MAEETAARLSPLVASDLDGVPADLAGGAVAVGNFDGVHRGHAALLARTIADARTLRTKAVVLTFEPHPRSFFRPAEPVFRLTPPAAKARVLAGLGLDGLVVAPFDAAFAGQSPEAFVTSVLVDRLKVRSLTVGDDFRFGKARAGTTAYLAEAGNRLGFEVDVVAPILGDYGERIASSEIREALESGDVAAANRLLGYRWFVIGTVVGGDRRGRELGFPTANIRLPADARLRHGIYAVTFTWRGGTHAGVASFGRRPQFDDGPPLLEVFIFDFAADLYGEEATVTFYGWIRPEMTFPSVDDLVSAMDSDAEKARRILAEAGPGSGLDRVLAKLR